MIPMAHDKRIRRQCLQQIILLVTSIAKCWPNLAWLQHAGNVSGVTPKISVAMPHGLHATQAGTLV